MPRAKTPTTKANGAAAKPKAAAAAAAPPAKPKAAAKKAAEVETDDAAARKQRHQLTEVLEVDISIARVQSHVRAHLVSKATEERLTALRSSLKEAKEKAKAEETPFDEVEEITQIKSEIDAINEGVVRIGGDAPIVIATVADTIVKQLLTFAMDTTAISNRKMVEVAALHQRDMSGLSVWPLIRNLDSVAGYDPDAEEVLRVKRAAANKAAKEAREAKKAAEAAGVEIAATADAADEEAADDDEHGSTTTTFNTYVDNATKTVKKQDEYKSMRVSNRLREVLAAVVAEFIGRIARISKITVLDLLKVRTLNAEHLVVILTQLMADELHGDEAAEEKIQSVLGLVHDKLALYHAHIKAEKERKWEEMDPEKKAAIESKKAEAEKERLKSRAAATKKKAIDTADLAKKLAAEVSASA